VLAGIGAGGVIGITRRSLRAGDALGPRFGGPGLGLGECGFGLGDGAGAHALATGALALKARQSERGILRRAVRVVALALHVTDARAQR
jgi:hypothetical protein